MNRIANLGVALIAAATPLAAQSGRPSVSSETGFHSEVYHIDGRPAQRPDGTLRFYASPTFTWLGLSVGLNLLWSTENQFAAQSINRYYLNPRWSWGQLHAGDYVPSHGRYTASSVRVRGGGIDLSPGPFRVSAAAGEALQATDLSVFDAAPRRMLYSGMIGVGNPNGTFVDFSALRAVDRAAGADMLSVPPQENLVGAVAAGLTLLGGRIRLRGEGSGSLFSRDIRAGPIDSIDQPEWTKSLFTPRVSSRFDYAWLGEARVTAGPGSFGAQYEYVGPGFTTLGNPYFVNDRREARMFGTLRVMRGRVNLAGSVGERRDNLAGDKRGTSRRRTGNFTYTIIGGRWLVSSANLMVNGTTRDPAPAPPTAPDPGVVDSFRLKNVALSVALVEQVRFTAGVPHQITVTLSEQRVDDASPRFGQLLDARSRAATLEYSVTLAGQFQVGVRPGYQEFEGAGVSESYRSMGVTLARRAPRHPLTATVTGTYTQLRAGLQLRQDAQLGFRLTPRDALSLQGRYTRLFSVPDPYTEFLGTLRYTRRW
ncbi:MAG TPA: hypothetical protein VNL18_12925 [Gemmatimonadales bacterium]|nr:hypothetical protein [Gemmatimonadales bacterium]